MTVDNAPVQVGFTQDRARVVVSQLDDGSRDLIANTCACTVSPRRGHPMCDAAVGARRHWLQWDHLPTRFALSARA